MPETCEKGLGLANSCVYYAREIQKIYRVLPLTQWIPKLLKYRQVSTIRRTKSHHLKDSRSVFWLSSPNPLKPDVMPRSQPAVRATALACLVLRRSYVSNSASPAADWGLKVILQPPYWQRTHIAAAVPPTHWIWRRKSHSEGTFKVLAPCLRDTFNVCSLWLRPHVRTPMCVSVPQWHDATPPTCVAGTIWAVGKCKFNASQDGLGRN